MDINNLGCINPYTGLLTSKKVTNVENRAELGKFMCNRTSIRVISREDLMAGMGKPLSLAEKTTVDKLHNSIDIAEGAKVTVEGGFVLTVGKEIVGISGGDLYNQKAHEKAAEMASALIMLLRNAGGTANIVAFSTPEYQKWTENVSRVMSYFGIDVSKDFTVNGMKYSKNKEGWWESAANTAAQEAYERQIAANKTYEFADERMKQRITHLSNYYLSAVPESVKEAWQETLEESGVNPFSDGFSTLSQLVMEQDLMTGGDDKIFGNTVESSLAATRKILDRIENPLGKVDENKAESLQREKKFYATLLRKLEKIQ
ncbi:MAG: hypothetical protein HDR16_00260 [Lachnospiraceae bacterium]|nr:hypothetical protein [Lachnospiraceae bacterium]